MICDGNSNNDYEMSIDFAGWSCRYFYERCIVIKLSYLAMCNTHAEPLKTPAHNRGVRPA